MGREIVIAKRRDGERASYVIEVFAEGDHWTSTLARLDEHGEPLAQPVAPRFYGLTADQARRRMITALENECDEVATAEE